MEVHEAGEVQRGVAQAEWYGFSGAACLCACARVFGTTQADDYEWSGTCQKHYCANSSAYSAEGRTGRKSAKRTRGPLSLPLE